jgi:predicted Zn-dependent peptidase
VVAGNLEEKDEALCSTYLSTFKKSSFVDKVKVDDRQTEPKLVLEYKKTDQYHLALGVRAYAAGHKDEIILKILGLILGGGMSSRLFTTLREREGLTYYVRTQIENYTDCGYLSTQAGLRLEEIEKAIKIILHEYARLRNELVQENELRKAKDMIAGRLAISLESSDNMANWYAKQFLTRAEALDSEEFLAQVNQVTALDIQRVAQDIFINEKLNLAIIGPSQDTEKFKALLSF